MKLSQLREKLKSLKIEPVEQSEAGFTLIEMMIVMFLRRVSDSSGSKQRIV